jgi:peptide/nickel transport system substrate-binding protein
LGIRLWPLLPLLPILAACGGAQDEQALGVSVIGGPPTLVDPNRTAPDPTQRVLLSAVAEGLVAFDEAGQIAPALAQRWIVTSDGLSAIFRLRRAAWPDGRAITTTELARRARQMTGPGSRNPLAGAFDSIEEINPTTPEVMEFRLSLPRPPLLELLAQPEAVILSRTLAGTGPYRVADTSGAVVTLVGRTEPEEGEPGLPQVTLRGERAARAILRFTRGDADLVLGGTYLDWPMVAIADPDQRTRRLDPAEGLFGLLVQRNEGFLATPENRQVLGMTVDRDALLSALNAPGLIGVLTVLPQRYRSAAEPSFPPWAAQDLNRRIEEARRRVAAWRAANPDPLRIRVHLPEGPGSNLLFARLAADWRRVGIAAERADLRNADVRLIDRIAPAGSALWYLNQVACPSAQSCSEEARTALQLARTTDSLFERGAQLAIADRTIAAAGLYIPLTRPLRWSLVARRLTGFRENAKAWHPLHLLLASRR